MPVFSVTPQIGFDLVNTVLATDITSGARTVPLNLGEQVFGSDGKLYVFGKANASIPASTTACTVSPTTFLATASGGSYTSPATAMVTGDYGWFSKASV
ncbi:hypothetical protein PIN31009_01896 [Pandoraea iniqua]|uniref:hypothetical protein n=1 Tax=Pandoraea iniqua TaxID=2508288 RepID=UPI001242E087|nr:hypothetical protein [Pandoraea iniqua]VVD96384.1 hypothetical protein PIN31009_01896 [Pandoraea iniqua]